MKTSQIFRAVAALTLVSALPLHASADVYRNGESFYGQPAASGKPNSRVVDLSSKKSVNVVYGETVVFKAADGKQFAWTFNGQDRRSVALNKIAPSNFQAPSATVYVGADPLNRN